MSWDVPTTRANGSPLAAGELAGYEIYVLRPSTGETRLIRVMEPLRTARTVQNLASDEYHFSMVAVDSEGNKSELSAVVSKTIPE